MDTKLHEIFNKLQSDNEEKIATWIRDEIIQPVGVIDGEFQTCSKCGYKYRPSDTFEHYKCPKCNAYLHKIELQEPQLILIMNVAQITCVNSMQAFVKYRVSIRISDSSKSIISVQPYSFILVTNDGDIDITHRSIDTKAVWKSDSTYHADYDRCVMAKEFWERQPRCLAGV